MLHRFKHFNRNIGTRYTIINLLVLAYLGYVFFGRGIDTASLVLAGILIFSALLPYVFLNRLVDNPARSSRIIRTMQFAIIILLIINLSGLWSPPAIVWFIAFPCIGLIIGGNFWLFSDPRVITTQGAAYYTAYAHVHVPDHQTNPHDQNPPSNIPPRVR